MDIKQAKDELSKGYRAFKAFENAVDVLRILELSEQSTKEHEQAVERARKTLSDLGEKIAHEEEILSSLMQQGANLSLKARDEAAAIIDAAMQKADENIKKAEKFLADVKDETKAHNEELKAVNDAVSSAKQELAAVNDKITEAKKAMTSALKGL